MVDYKAVVSSFFNSSGLHTFGAIFFWAIIVIVIIAAVGTGLAIYLYNKKFNLIIIRFEKIGGKTESNGRFKGMLRNIGHGGTKALYIRGLKILLPVPQVQTGPNVYWYYVASDKEWRNIGIQDIDEKLNAMDVQLVDADMRYAKEELHESMRNEYNKLTFWDKYQGAIISIIFIVITGLILYFIASKLVGALGTMKDLQAGQKEIIDGLKQLLTAENNIRGGSGYVQT